MRLNRILDGYEYELVKGSLDIDIKDIVNDSREAGEGSLFVAEEGYRVDGHDFIEDVFSKGCRAVIISKDMEPAFDMTVIRVAESYDALAYALAKLNKKPWEDLHLIGITGTNGKTSTTYFLKSIFEHNRNKTGLIGTMGAKIGDLDYEIKNTTPNAYILNDIFLKMKEENIDYSFMEVSSHALALKRVEYMDFEVSVFTNLAKDHLDYHKTVEHYFESKALLFEKTNKASIINIDDKYGQILEKRLRKQGKKVISFSIKKEADLRAIDISFGLSNVEYTLVTPVGETRVKLNIPGEFSIYNSISAAAVAYAYGLDLKVIKEGLEAVEGVKGRFEVVPTNTPYTVIIDFAHTAEGLDKVLEVIDEFVVGRKIVVFGAGGNRDRSKRPEMGEIVARHGAFSIVTSDNPRDEKPEDIIEDILVGTRTGNGDYVSIVNRIDAIKYAIDMAEAGDIILLAGKGHETYTIIGDKTIPCDERQIVLDYLKEIKGEEA